MYVSITSNLDYIRNETSSTIYTYSDEMEVKNKRTVTHCIMLEINILFFKSTRLLVPFTIYHDCTSGCARAHKASLKIGMVSVLVLFTTNCILPSAFFAPLPVEALP